MPFNAKPEISDQRAADLSNLDVSSIGSPCHSGGGDRQRKRCQLALPSHDTCATKTPILTSDLRPQRAVRELGIEPSPVQIQALRKLGDSIFETPLRVNQRNEIIDGRKRWLIAKSIGREYLDCEIEVLTEEETLREILRKDLAGPSLNKFCRVLIALKMEKFHERRARANRIEGGKKKQLLFLTTADRACVQSLVAKDAGVSPSVVRQVKIILKAKPCDELLAGLRCEMISIHRGYQLCEFPLEKQRAALAAQQGRKLNRTKAGEIIARLAPSPERRHSVGALKQIQSALRSLPDDPLLAPLQSQISSILEAVDRLLALSLNDSQFDARG